MTFEKNFSEKNIIKNYKTFQSFHFLLAKVIQEKKTNKANKITPTYNRQNIKNSLLFNNPNYHHIQPVGTIIKQILQLQIE